MTTARVLVVDDEEAVAEVLQYLLEDEGYTVVTATSAGSALTAAGEGEFAAVVLDVSMGEIGGTEIAQALKAEPSTAHVPIVILTGLPERAVRERFTDYDLFVSKGADLSEFVERLASLIASVGSSNGASAHAGKPSPSPV